MDRDTALGVKANVDDMLAGFGPVENSVSNLGDRLEDSLDAKDNLRDRLGKVGIIKRRSCSPITTLVGLL